MIVRFAAFAVEAIPLQPQYIAAEKAVKSLAVDWGLENLVKRAANSGERTADAIRRAGLKLIYQKGYAAVSMRDLAQEVGIGLSSIYNHISTKQALLVELLLAHMNSLLGELKPALEASASLGGRERLLAFLVFHLRYHLTRRVEVFVINSELRSLEPENLAEVVALRRAYEDQLVAILKAGKADGSLRIADPQVTAFALISMLTGVCNWYQPSGRLSQDEIVKMHVDMILSGLAMPIAELQPKAG